MLACTFFNLFGGEEKSVVCPIAAIPIAFFAAYSINLPAAVKFLKKEKLMNRIYKVTEERPSVLPLDQKAILHEPFDLDSEEVSVWHR